MLFRQRIIPRQGLHALFVHPTAVSSVLAGVQQKEVAKLPIDFAANHEPDSTGSK